MRRSARKQPVANTGRSLVAWNLRLIRIQRGFRQVDLSLKSGVDRSLLSLIECKKRTLTIDMLDRLAAALSTPIESFFKAPRKGASAPEPLRKRPRSMRSDQARKLAGAA